MSVVDSVKAKLDEYAYIIKAQMEELDRLREENDRLKSNLNAHQTLRLIYSDPDASRSERIKAAAASLPHETPKLMPERAPLELQAEPEQSLIDLHAERLERHSKFAALSLEQRSALIAGVRRDGRAEGEAGSDGSDGNQED